jgi:thioester reductase-like protein
MGDRTVLVTGATSLLGRLVVAELLARECRVLALIRPSSSFTESTLCSSLRGLDEIPQVGLSFLRGDVWEPDLGLGSDISSRLKDVTEIVHLARPRVSEEPLLGARAKGIDGVMDLARRLGGVRRLIMLSSTDVSGDYQGRFYEDWLDIGQTLSTQRARDTLEAERRARQGAAYLPIHVVRHAILVGHSCTGQMECDAGFSRIFAWADAVRRMPSFIHPLAPAAGERFVPVSPVDFVAAAIVEILLSDRVEQAETFCLADPEPLTLAELFDLVLDRAGGPAAGLRLAVDGRGAVGRGVQLFARVGAALNGALGRGAGPWAFLLQRGEHDLSNALRVLAGTDVSCPRLPTYFDALYEDYRRRHGRLQS